MEDLVHTFAPDGSLEETVAVPVPEEVANQRAIETNLAQDLEAMQAILDTPNATINSNPAAVIKDIARMNKRLGRTAIDDYSEAD